MLQTATSTVSGSEILALHYSLLPPFILLIADGILLCGFYVLPHLLLALLLYGFGFLLTAAVHGLREEVRYVLRLLEADPGVEMEAEIVEGEP